MTRLLIFSDLHNDVRALEKLMDIEAGYYFAAGDLVSWARGLDKMAEPMKRRTGRVYVLPGNHESERDIAEFCERHGFVDHARGLTADCFAVDTAADGNSGLELATAYHYDLIILDLMLPEMSGTEILRRLRRKDTNVPVLVVGTQVEKNASPDAFNQALDNAGYPRAGVAKARNQQAPPKPEPTPPAAPPEKK